MNAGWRLKLREIIESKEASGGCHPRLVRIICDYSSCSDNKLRRLRVQMLSTPSEIRAVVDGSGTCVNDMLCTALPRGRSLKYVNMVKVVAVVVEKLDWI